MIMIPELRGNHLAHKYASQMLGETESCRSGEVGRQIVR